MAVTCASLATLLVAHHPILVAQSVDATHASPLVVFAEPGVRADLAPLSAGAAVTLEAIRSDPAVSGIRIGRAAPAAIAAALDARVLSVVVPPAHDASAVAAEAVIAFTGVDVKHNDEGMVSLYAQDDATDSEVAVVIQGADVLGSIRHGDETFKVHPLGDGLTAVYHYDTSQLRRHPPNRGEFMRKNERMHRHAPAAPPRDETGEPGAAADTGDVIDILVAYTPAARRAAGNIDTFIQFAVDNTHRIYRNSNIGLRLQLVHKYEASYTEHPSDMGADLDRLAWTSDTIVDGERWDPDGYMDEVHGLRDRYGADLVALITARPTNGTCGIAFIPDFGRYPDRNLGILGFSVTAWNCETSTNHTFAHELGHNQGALHDPDNSCNNPPCVLSTPPSLAYRYGRCNTAEGWSTTMSYGSNLEGSCRREIEYFSSPILNYRGTPTGDAARRDNRRVLLETARRVANYRQSKPPPPPPPPPTATSTHILPFVTPASKLQRQGFVRIINHSDRTGKVSISAIDDSGQRFGPVSLSLQARAAAHLNSHDLENGNPRKGLSGGVGDGSGNWRLVLRTDLAIEPLAYARTTDGFVTSMHEVAAETKEGANRYHVPFFNPGRNRNQVSRLRLINPGRSRADIKITGVDDSGRTPPSGSVGLTLGAGRARMLDAHQLENGGSGLSGRLGAGTGRWRLSVSANHPILVMSLLSLPSGHLTNLSRGQGDSAAMPPTTPVNQPDLVVQSPSVSDSHLNTGQSFTFSVTVRNRGSARSAATTLRYFRSSNATISSGDSPVGTDAVGGLSASGTSGESVELTAPSSAGTYYYGACVDSVSGEADTRNNCSTAVPVTVSSTGQPDLVVQSPSVSDSHLNTGQSFTFSVTVRNRGNARSAATTLRYFRSPDATISSGDSPVGTDAVGDLSASGTSGESAGLTAPSSAGTYYYGACVDSVSGEADTRNNCSTAVPVTVSTTGTNASYCNSGNATTPRYGAIARGWKGQYCDDGFGWGYSYELYDRDSAISRAESECRGLGLRGCVWVVTFTGCGAIAYGESSSRCGHWGGHGATRTAAEQHALSNCRIFYPYCRIPVGVGGSGAGEPPLAEAQSGSGITDSPFGASNPEARPEPEPSRQSDGGWVGSARGGTDGQ